MIQNYNLRSAVERWARQNGADIAPPDADVDEFESPAGSDDESDHSGFADAISQSGDSCVSGDSAGVPEDLPSVVAAIEKVGVYLWWCLYRGDLGYY